jgi:FixJ family two-component response regulator
VVSARRKRRPVIVVVDDDASLRGAIADFLNSQGFTTRGFSSGEQFLRSRLRGTTGCLILDLRLPGMSGLDLHRQLQARGSAVPVIYCTAEQDVDGRVRRQLLQAGALAVLYKPFAPEQLLRLVEDACLERTTSGQNGRGRRG